MKKNKLISNKKLINTELTNKNNLPILKKMTNADLIELPKINNKLLGDIKNIKNYSELCDNNCKTNKCAIGKEYDGIWCFSREWLIKILKKLYGKNSFNFSDLSKKKIVELINFKFKHCNNNQNCWIKQKEIIDMNDEEILLYTFLPYGPNKKNGW